MFRTASVAEYQATLSSLRYFQAAHAENPHPFRREAVLRTERLVFDTTSDVHPLTIIQCWTGRTLLPLAW